MRLPEEFRSFVSFLGTWDTSRQLRYPATPFFVGFPIPTPKPLYHPYLVTAAHSIRRAQQTASPLFVRFNVAQGNSIVLEMTTDWIFHDDEAVDLAVLPFDPPETYEVGLIPTETFATDRDIQGYDFGIGD